MDIWRYPKHLARFFALTTSLVALLAVTAPANAGNLVLSNNSGNSSLTWFISGEASLVMNGFDLTPLGVNLPVSVDRVSIDVVTPSPGAAIDVVVYQDANGGSPVDATIVGQKQVDITTSGVFTATFDQPLQITAPVLWVGFYLPVDFVFRADNSGASTLTYWAWQPNARFDLTNLSSAAVLGPANGSEPVNINMNGIARITAEIITDGSETVVPVTSTTTTTEDNRIFQIVGDAATSLGPMTTYTFCLPVSYDSADVFVTYRGGIRWFCRLVPSSLSPPPPAGYTQTGGTFDIFLFGVESGVTRLPYPVTHCIQPEDAILSRAVLGLAHGAPRQWEILPTVRFGSVICAEVPYAGFISDFVPN